ncbi:MAG: alpha/beta hydrolase [Rhizobiales bacterium]|nr:alpha/beta hydrolase [Hyphomicrobiales bacterium]
MPTFSSDGVEIAYREAGEGPPVLLIHGFGSNIVVNWGDTGWISTLANAGHRVIALDNRGHGASAKLYDKTDYAAPLMAEDARRLLDHLGIGEADVMGYSMGARISAFLAIAHPARVRRLVLAGLAANMIDGVPGGEAIAQALEAESMADVAGAEPRAFRKFAEQTRSDLKALAACMRSAREKIDREALARIRCPVLVVAGELDDIAGPVAPLVDAIPNAKGVVLPRRNHMNAVGDRDFKAAVVEFLA